MGNIYALSGKTLFTHDIVGNMTLTKIWFIHRNAYNQIFACEINFKVKQQGRGVGEGITSNSGKSSNK